MQNKRTRNERTSDYMQSKRISRVDLEPIVYILDEDLDTSLVNRYELLNIVAKDSILNIDKDYNSPLDMLQ